MHQDPKMDIYEGTAQIFEISHTDSELQKFKGTRYKIIVKYKWLLIFLNSMFLLDRTLPNIKYVKSHKMYHKNRL